MRRAARAHSPWGSIRAPLFLAALLVLCATPARAEHCPPPRPTDLPDAELPPKARWQWTPQEIWVWWQIRLSGKADLDAVCSRFDPRSEDWALPSQGERRLLTQRFLLDLLNDEALAGSLPNGGVEIVGAWFDAPVDLSGVRFKHELRLEKARFDDGLSLRGARLDGSVSLKKSLFRGPLNLEGTRIDGTLNLEGSRFERPESGKDGSVDALVAGGLTTAESLWMERAWFGGDVTLVEASIGDQFSADDSTFAGKLDMNGMQVGLSTVLTNAYFKSRVRLWNARVGRFLDLRRSDFEGEVDLSGIEIGSQLYLGSCALFKDTVKLRAAKLGGSLYADSGLFARNVDMSGLRSGQTVFLGRSPPASRIGEAAHLGCPDMTDPGSQDPRLGAAFIGDVSIAEGRVAGAVEMSEATFFGNLDMGGLQVEGSLYMHNANFGSILALPGASVRGDTKYGGGRPPGRATLTGFRYERILSEKVRKRENDDIEEPIDWPSLNRELINLQVPYSSEPYEYLASVLQRMGDAETAINVLYDSAACDLAVRIGWSDEGRCKETPMKPASAMAVVVLLSLAATGLAWRHGGKALVRPRTDLGASPGRAARAPRHSTPSLVAPFLEFIIKQRFFVFLIATSLLLVLALTRTHALLFWTGTLVKVLYGLTVGFGYYPQLAIYWVLEFTLIGVLVLSFSQEARKKGLFWCFGASLDHLLPVVELNKGFSDFFDGTPGRLKAWQFLYFAFHALVGFVLASFVVAGLSGLTAKS